VRESWNPSPGDLTPQKPKHFPVFRGKCWNNILCNVCSYTVLVWLPPLSHLTCNHDNDDDVFRVVKWRKMLLMFYAKEAKLFWKEGKPYCKCRWKYRTSCDETLGLHLDLQIVCQHRQPNITIIVILSMNPFCEVEFKHTKFGKQGD